MKADPGELGRMHGEVDVVVIGAGVAGLWSACTLAQSGARVVLVSASGVGAEQTIASQGIIHGGVKYALGGAASSAARAIAAMPGAWRACLRGEGAIDLRGARVLSDGQWLWTSASLTSRLTGLAASKAIRTPVHRVSNRGELPEGLSGAPAGVDVYHVPEPVLEPSSLVHALLGACVRAGVRVVTGRAALAIEGGGVGGVVVAGADGVALRIVARCVVLCSGAGNAGLLAGLGGALGGLHQASPVPRMQVRPLHMVMVRGALPSVYGHCVAGLSDKPRVTIGTQDVTQSRERVWYVGGNIAEAGVTRSREEQILAARAELAECIGWVKLDGCAFATRRWDRAEGLTEDGTRPDEPVVRAVDAGGTRVIAVWPTKLAFAPLVGQLVGELVGKQAGPLGGSVGHRVADALASGRSRGQDELASRRAIPPVAPLPWLEEGVRWTS